MGEKRWMGRETGRAVCATMEFVLGITLSLILGACVGESSPTGGSVEDELARTIIDNLVKNELHLIRPSHRTQVEMSVDLLEVRELSKKTGIGELYVEEHYMWHEPRVQWEPSDFPGVKHLRLPASYFWRPDVFMSNDRSLHPDSLDGQVTVQWDGHVSWSPRVIHHTRCWAERQPSRRNRLPDWACELVYGSKDFGEEELSLVHCLHGCDSGLNVRNTKESDEWAVKRSGVNKSGSEVTYSLTLEEVPYVRRAPGAIPNY